MDELPRGSDSRSRTRIVRIRNLENGEYFVSSLRDKASDNAQFAHAHNEIA